MHKILVLVHLILSLLNLKLNAQNFVPNYSFEVYTSCPTAASQVSFAVPWTGTNNSTDYYNSCAPPCFLSVPCQSSASFQYAKTGDAFAGMWFLNGYGGDYREYLQTQLLDTLLPSTCYKVSFFLNNHNSIKYAINNFGVHLSNNSYTTTWGPPPYTPQILGFNNEIIDDTLNWVEISGIYTANGGEKYITIGNFSDDANTDTLDTGNGTYNGAYYYIDDVSVIPIDSIPGGMPAYAGADTNMIVGDSVFIGQKISNLNCNWYNAIGSLIASGTSGIYVSPTVSTFYVVEQNLCGVITYDTVNVTVLPVSIYELQSNNSVQVYPNPNNGSFTIQFLQTGNYQVELINSLGITVYQKQINSDLYTIKTKQPNGWYLLKTTHLEDNTTYFLKMIIQH